MAATPASNVPEYSVSELSGELKRTLEDRFGRVSVRGEISGFKRASSGHMYFGLKDDKALIDGIVWRGTAAKLGFRPEDGLEVVCMGRVTSYPARSKYQIVIDRMEPAGEGALMALLEQRRKALAAEGLFAPERKQPLPFLPRHIGIVTSPTGAVIRDIMHRLSDRFPRPVTVWPVRVQGDGAAEEIAAAIRGFNTMPSDRRPDLLIVARGGGSIEDLWAFNEEVVVRAAADSRIPLISAVGHETDTTLIDFAADVRAPTPTAAAERAVPVRSELAMQVQDLVRRGAAALRRSQVERANHLTGLGRGLVDPRRLLQQHQQRLDDLGDALGRALQINAGRGRQRLTQAAGGLRPSILRNRMQDGRQRTDLAARTLSRDMARLLADRQSQLAGTARLLESFSYRATLQRGFAVIRRDGAAVTRADALAAGDRLEIEFADGRQAARVDGGAPDGTRGDVSDEVTGAGGDDGGKPARRPAQRPARKAPKPGTGQGSLF